MLVVVVDYWCESIWSPDLNSVCFEAVYQRRSKVGEDVDTGVFNQAHVDDKLVSMLLRGGGE